MDVKVSVLVDNASGKLNDLFRLHKVIYSVSYDMRKDFFRDYCQVS